MRLYLGLDCPEEGNWMHFPVIKIEPRRIDIGDQLNACTHLIFTSKSAVRILHASLPRNKIVLSVGAKTSAALIETGIHPQFTAQEETAEGIMQLLDTLPLEGTHIFWPHSALSRPLLLDYLTSRKIAHSHCVLYDTVLNKPESLPDLETVDEIAFTSPSTVANFFLLYPEIPTHIKLTCIGPVTQAYLNSQLLERAPRK